MNQDETKTWNLGNPRYALTRRVVGGDFDSVVERVRTELGKVGFGVLTEIDMKGTFKNKLDVDVPRYLILGACNPPLAYQALSADPGVGALLPCNVMVIEEQGAIVVSTIDPVAMFSVVDNPAVAPLAAAVRSKLEQMLARLAEA